jgi:hypothetical protein
MDGTRVALVIANDQDADPRLRRLVAPAQPWPRWQTR